MFENAKIPAASMGMCALVKELLSAMLSYKTISAIQTSKLNPLVPYTYVTFQLSGLLRRLVFRAASRLRVPMPRHSDCLSIDGTWLASPSAARPYNTWLLLVTQLCPPLQRRQA